MIESRTEDAALVCSVCENLATWEPIIHTWPTGSGNKITAPTLFDVDMPICDAHRLQLSPRDFLCDEIWTGILDWAFRNKKPIPDRMTAEVRFRKINHEIMVH